MRNSTTFTGVPKFGEIRTVDVDGEIYFAGNDVAKALGYYDPPKAVSRHCNGWTFRPLIDGMGRTQNTKVIPEGDVYTFELVSNRIDHPVSQQSRMQVRHGRLILFVVNRTKVRK